jgi:ABC-2 type transport system permease protein/sodium transport system permease protein
VLVTGFLFGMAHWVLNVEFGFARSLPSFALGIVIGGVREASGSIWPGMLLHYCHNAILILKISDGATEETNVEPLWILVGAAGSGIGAGLVWLGRARVPSHDD